MLQVPHLMYLLYSFKRKITHFLRSRIKKLFQKTSVTKEQFLLECWSMSTWVPSEVPITPRLQQAQVHTPHRSTAHNSSHIFFHGEVVKAVFYSSILGKACVSFAGATPVPETPQNACDTTAPSQVSHTQRKALLGEKFLLNGPKMDKELHFSSTQGWGAARERSIGGDGINLLLDPFWDLLRKMHWAPKGLPWKAQKMFGFFRALHFCPSLNPGQGTRQPEDLLGWFCYKQN